MLERYAAKVKTAAAALALVREGETVFIGTACATPRSLVEALHAQYPRVSDLRLIHYITDGALPQGPGAGPPGFRHQTIFMGLEMRELLDRGGAVDYHPLSLAQVPLLVRAGRVRPEVALVQVSPPDEGGYMSLGISVDVAPCAIQAARLVIAEVNPRMPRVLGDSFVHMDDVDVLVPVDRPLAQFTHEPVDRVSTRIAQYIANLIDEGSTLQVGTGQIVNEALRHLEGKRNLGIHSDLVTDAVLDLVQSGVVTSRRKTLHRGRIVASYAFGTQRLYDALDRNPLFAFYPIEYVCDPAIIAAQHRMVSINQAFSIDLTGQVCADQFNGRFFGGVAATPEFLRAAAASPGGKPILCLASTTADESVSRIRARLPDGEGVTIARSDVHYIVTEFGIAYLFGKSIRERALALIEIAHPTFRADLLAQAKELGYLPSAQHLASRAAYPVGEEREATLRDGRRVRLRPARASDGDAVRGLFYDMSEEDIHRRFFSRIACLSFEQNQRLCNVDYVTEVAFVAVAGPPENERLVATASYYLNQSTGLAEVAYLVKKEWQSGGLGRALQQRLFEYGAPRGVRGFVAEVLRVNARMIEMAKRSCERVTVEFDDDVVVITMFPTRA